MHKTLHYLAVFLYQYLKIMPLKYEWWMILQLELFKYVFKTNVIIS